MATWPGTAGGAYSPHWGENVRLYIWAAIQAGTVMHWGPHATAVLNAGNVWSSGGPQPTPSPPAGTMWVDLSCDVLDLEVHLGADQVSPPTNVADAGTCAITLVDPDRRYDPLNPDGPYQYGGSSRLGSGTAIRVFAETLTTPTTVTQHPLFLGTVDTWREDWTPHPTKRRANVVASDAVKTLTGLDWGEQPAVGNGDYMGARLARILDFYGWTGGRGLDFSYMRYGPTTFDGSAWDLLARTVTDDNGYLFIDGNGAVTTAGENRWAVRNPTMILQVGCGADVTGVYDIAVDVEVDTSVITNSVTAGRTDATPIRYTNATSITQYGEQGIKTTDLGLYDDTEVTRYANSILGLRAFPRGQLTSVTVRPQLDPTCWAMVFRNQVYLSKEHMRVVWQPPDSSTAYDVKGRPFGVTHAVTHAAWDVTYPLAYADVYTRIMHWGPHAYDKLNAGNVYV
jgi:hypothetical protein